MQALRDASAAVPLAAELTWRQPDDMSDWTLIIGNGVKEYRVHTALLASGPRRSEVLRQDVLSSNAERRTDVGLHIQEEARETVINDPLMLETFETLLDWQYGSIQGFLLPSFAGSHTVKQRALPQAAAPVRATSSQMVAAASTEDDTMLSYFSSAIFGTPSRESPAPAAVAPPTTNVAVAPSMVVVDEPAAPSAKAIKAAQVPLLWQLADALRVCGLKAVLLPMFEEAPLSAAYVMTTPAYERLKMLVRALELHASEIVNALYEQLRIPAAATMRDAMSELAVAASACDTARYEALSRTGLLPTDETTLAVILDTSRLRVASEAQVHDLLCHYLSTTDASAAVQESLWATCRFSYLPADRLVSLAEQPNVPPRWLALACARSAASGASGTRQPGASLSALEEVRLTPRDFYEKRAQ